MSGIIGKIPSRSKIVNEPLTDGGVLLGSGAEAITATAALADGEMLVGDGTTDPAIESGATLRTSIGLGNVDNVADASQVSVGALNSGSITSGFGTINTGSSTITTTGAIAGATLDTGQGANELYDMNQNVLTTSGVTHDKLTATTGVLFGTDTAAANTLDDYEEGNWTPDFRNNDDGTGVLYVTAENKAYYTKVGRQINIYGRLALTNKGSATGGPRIYGLPLAASSDDSGGYPVNLYFSLIAHSGSVQGYIYGGNDFFYLAEVHEDGTRHDLSDSDVNNNCFIFFSASYRV
tara:strand:+ start:604 stop:1482 length:879 start_codon:yes stop_codon:yes gene_type:complete